MGVSLRNPFYSKKKNILKAVNLAKDFDEFLIFVVDSPYELSLQAFNNLPKKEAEKIISKEGGDLKNFLIKVTKRFKFVKVSSFQKLKDEDYRNLLSEMKELSQKNTFFLDLIKKEFTGNIFSKINNDKEKEKLCIEFILEEIALFCSLVKKGYKTRISKYSISKSIEYYLNNKNLTLNHLQIK